MHAVPMLMPAASGQAGKTAGDRASCYRFLYLIKAPGSARGGTPACGPLRPRCADARPCRRVGPRAWVEPYGPAVPSLTDMPPAGALRLRDAGASRAAAGALWFGVEASDVAEAVASVCEHQSGTPPEPLRQPRGLLLRALLLPVSQGVELLLDERPRDSRDHGADDELEKRNDLPHLLPPQLGREPPWPTHQSQAP